MSVTPKTEEVITTDDVARRALAGFRSMAPQLTSIARALTDKPRLNVRPGSTTYTDGDDIFLSVTPTMADQPQHLRAKCGRRDALGDPACPACAKHEDIIVPLYHEMGHIVYGSFKELDNRVKQKMIRESLNMLENIGVSDWLVEKVEEKLNPGRFTKSQKTAMEIGSWVSPWMPMLLNALEDCRIDAQVMLANPGSVKMYKSQARKIFENGIAHADGSVTMWYEQPPNSQWIIGLYLIAGGYGIQRGWLSNKVTDDLQDPELLSMLRQVSASEDAAAVYLRTLPIIIRSVELGYLEIEEPEEGEGEGSGTGEAGEGMSFEAVPSQGDSSENDDDDGEQSASGGSAAPDEDDDEESEGDGGAGSTTESSDEDADDDGNGGSGDDGEDDDGEEAKQEEEEGEGDEGGDEQDGNGSEEEEPAGTVDEAREALEAFRPHPEHDRPQPAVEIAISQYHHFEGPSTKVGLIKTPKLDESQYRHKRATSLDVDMTLVQQNLGQIRAVFSDNIKGKTDRNRRSGLVDARVLGLRVPVEDDRLFKKRTLPGKRDYHVVVGLDVSGSTSHGWHDGRRIIESMKEMALMQCELLHKVGVSFEMWCHTAVWNYNGQPTDLYMVEVKNPHEPFTDKVRERIAKVHPMQANLDGHTLEFYRKRLDKSNATDKLIIYYTDGNMPAENYEEELEILQREIEVCRQSDYDLLAVGVGNDDPLQYGLDTVRVDGQKDMSKVVKGLRRKLTGR